MKKVIYIVEDEKDLNSLVCSYLNKEGYETGSFTTFGDALAHVEDDVQLWLLDIMLDEKSGYELLEAIRDHNNNIPVIFMSARDKEFDRIIGLEKGSDDYITKPFSPKELVLRVNNVMKRTYKGEIQRLMVDGYEIDESQRKVFLNGDELDLTTKEFDLLMLFVRNRGLAFSREQILERVWEANYFGSERVVDDTLRRLRKKMEAINIQTIYGYGYRLG